MVTAEVSEQAPQLIPHTEAKAKVWVANLPITNPGETTKRLFYGLVDLNRRALPVATRIAIGEMLIPSMGVALEALQRHLVARAFPLTTKTQKIFELAQSLTLEFAGLYQVAALDIITKKEGNKKLLSVALYRALDYMTQVLLLNYSVYIRTRETLWHDIHHLYLLAVENGVDQVKLKEHNIGAPSIEARYIQANLLALSKPYSLRQGEVTRLAQYYMQHTPLTSLSREPENQSSAYVYAVILNSDEPAALIPISDLPHSPTVRVLNLHNLLALLDKHIRDLEASGVPPMLMQQNGLSRNLAKRVIYHLTSVRNRNFNRFPKNEKVGMVTQLKDVLDVVLDSGKNSKTAIEEDLLFNVFAYNEGADDSEQTRQVALKTEQEVGARIQSWRILNSSLGGYGLCWEDKEESGARVGEIVALRDLSNEHASWMVGVIKWMEFVNDKGLCCGVELLSTKSMPLTVLTVRGRKLQQALPMDGLMLPSIEGVRPDPALILPAYIFREEDEITLKFAERTEQVRLLLLDECLGAFAHFRFDKVLANKMVEDEYEDFNAIWAAL